MFHYVSVAICFNYIYYKKRRDTHSSSGPLYMSNTRPLDSLVMFDTTAHEDLLSLEILWTNQYSSLSALMKDPQKSAEEKIFTK